MKINIDNNCINYEVSGCGSPLIFLHGWGSDLHTFDKLTAQINDEFTVYQIDLPGFGLSEMPRAYSIFEYASIINEFCFKLKIQKPTIIGHSFGGRIAIMYASLYDVNKLVLISSPGIKAHFNLIKWFKIKIYKLSKKFSLNLNMGSIDYKNASKNLKDTLVKAVNCDLTNEAKKINCDTLLIYGINDKSVPIYIGKKIQSLIKNSALITVKRCGHFPYVERFRYTLIILKSFLFGNKL